jgi:hypothetical protein
MAGLLLLLLLLPALAAAQATHFTERLARARNATTQLGATPLNNACGGAQKWSLGTVTDATLVSVGCVNSAVRPGALYDAQSVQYTLTTANSAGLGYDFYRVFVLPSCDPSSTASPLNGAYGDYITSPFTSPTFTCASSECCLFIFCENSVLPCNAGKLSTDFSLRANGGVVAGIVIGVLAVVAIAAACALRARRRAAAESTYAAMPAQAPGVVVYNAAAAPSAPPQYQQPAFAQPVYQPQQQYQQPPQQYQQPPQQYQQPMQQYQQPQQYQQQQPQQWR